MLGVREQSKQLCKAKLQLTSPFYTCCAKGYSRGSLLKVSVSEFPGCLHE